MTVYRRVHISFWQDPDVLELTPEQKYFYLYLMTNSKTRQCGCYEISKKVMELETGYNSETIDKLISSFVDMGKIQYCNETREILLKNWHKHNSSSSDKIKRCVEKEVADIKNKDFKKYCMDTLSIDYKYCMDTQPQKEKEKEKEKVGKKTNRFQPPSIQDIKEYCKERGNNVNAEQFHDFYASKNWYVGKNKMKDWKAAVRTWEKRDNTPHQHVNYL